MKKIGITGLISSGKSSVAKLLSKKVYPIFDADKEVQNIYKNKKFLKKLKFSFNLSCKHSQLKNEIKKLIKQKKIKFKKLEKLIHPMVRLQMKKFVNRNRKKKILIFEIPLLIESKLMRHFDIIILVSSPKKIRMQRYLRRGGSKFLFNYLNSRQISENKKRKFCQHVIKNNRSLNVLKISVSNIINNYE